jgi:hypothetical protein
MLIMLLTPVPIAVRGINELTQLIHCHEINCKPVYQKRTELRCKVLPVSTVWEFSAEMQVI